MKWTKLEGTPIWDKVMWEYKDPRRKYHNADHIEAIYEHAQDTFEFEYDESLDHAILGHDMIYDPFSEKERRSADWICHYCKVDGLRNHIMKTVSHELSDDNRVVLLDLADLMFEERRVVNWYKIYEESINLYNVSRYDFAKANAEYMIDLEGRMKSTRHLAKDEEQPFIDRILTGISETANFSQQVMYEYSQT